MKSKHHKEHDVVRNVVRNYKYFEEDIKIENEEVSVTEEVSLTKDAPCTKEEYFEEDDIKEEPSK